MLAPSVALAFAGLLCVHGQAIMPVADGNCNPDNPPTLIQTDNVVITSVNYDNAMTYPPNSVCEWLIQLPTSGEYTALSIGFTDFYVPFCVDCSCDRVTLYDGANDTFPVIAVLCSSDAAGVYQPTGSSMFMRFETGDGPGGDGWRALVNMVRWDTNACSGTATTSADSGWFTSPSYPLNYENRLDCYWQITASGGPSWRVLLAVDDFQTEGEQDCQVSDFVQLYDGPTDRDTQMNRLNGVIGGGAFTYEGYDSNVMLVYFRSNIAINHRGFNLTWTAVNRA